VAWQSVALAGATGTALLVVRALGVQWSYVAAVAWALVAVVIRAAGSGAPALAGVAALGLGVVLAAAVTRRRRPPRPCAWPEPRDETWIRRGLLPGALAAVHGGDRCAGAAGGCR
jgi:hypothetical protein